MHVLFLEVDTTSTWAAASIGPAFIGAYLRQHGHRVSFLRVTLDMGAAEVVAHLEALQPGLLGLSLTTRQWRRGRDLVAEIRAWTNRAGVSLPIIAGGLHPTFAPEETLASPGFDYVCLGEGEAAMLDLVTALESGDGDGGKDGAAATEGGVATAADTAGGAPADSSASPAGQRRSLPMLMPTAAGPSANPTPDVSPNSLPNVSPNIWARGGSRPPLREPFAPIDDLPYLARDMLDEQPGVVHMATQRGCPFPCTYCAARMYNQLYRDRGEYGRRRSHANVLDELSALKDAGKLAYVIFLDDTFTIHHPWVREFCRVYRRDIGVPFSLHARVETVNEKLLHTLAEAGCQQITYGVESGSERIRREIMRRPVTNQRFIDVFRWTREAGIYVTANYMLGLPGETRADLQATLDLARDLDVLDFGYFVFYPYPGTQLFQLCRERGYLPEDYLDLPSNHRESILRMPQLSAGDIAEYYDKFTALRRALYDARLPPELAADSRAAALSHVDERARLG